MAYGGEGMTAPSAATGQTCAERTTSRRRDAGEAPDSGQIWAEKGYWFYGGHSSEQWMPSRREPAGSRAGVRSLPARRRHERRANREKKVPDASAPFAVSKW